MFVILFRDLQMEYQNLPWCNWRLGWFLKWQARVYQNFLYFSFPSHLPLLSSFDNQGSHTVGSHILSYGPYRVCISDCSTHRLSQVSQQHFHYLELWCLPGVPVMLTQMLARVDAFWLQHPHMFSAVVLTGMAALGWCLHNASPLAVQPEN